ncbi:MAG: branched-chain amino acid ABC transporter substrate-binding protein [Holophaga sp.]
MRFKETALAMAGLLLCLSPLGCGKKEGASASGKELKIGIQLPLTGGSATDGLALKRTYDLWIEQVNAKGGINGKTITPVYVDDGCDPQMASTAANKAISEGVVLVTGTFCSGAALPAMSLYNDAKIPFMIANANSLKLVDQNPGNAFILPYTSRHQVLKALEIAKKIGAKKIALVDEGDAFSGDLARDSNEIFTQNGLNVVAKETMNKGEQDTSALVTTLISKKPDLVFWTAYYADGALLVKNLRAAGYKGKYMAGDGSSGAQFIELSGKAAEGAIVLSPPIAQVLPSAAKFVADYKAKYPNQEPGPYEPCAYHACQIIENVLSRTSSLKMEDILKAAGETNMDTILGHVQFEKNHTISNSLVMATVVKDGKYELLN